MNGFLKAGALSMLSAILIGGSALAQLAQAETIGFVDLEKIYSDYDKAAGVRADIKVKEADLRKMQADFVKQLEESRKANPKNPVSNDMLEKELNDKLNARLTEYRDWITAQQDQVEKEIKVAIEEVVKSHQVDVVLTKPAVYLGGTNLTSEVLGRLNTGAAKPMPKPAMPPAKK